MATATDACSGVTVTFADSELPCHGSRVIEDSTAQDGCGNVATYVQTIPSSTRRRRSHGHA